MCNNYSAPRYALALGGLGCPGLAARAEAAAASRRTPWRLPEPADRALPPDPVAGQVGEARAAALSAVASVAARSAAARAASEGGASRGRGDAGRLKAAANEDYKLGEYAKASGGYTAALDGHTGAREAAALLADFTRSALQLLELRSSIGAACAAVRLGLPPRSAADSLACLALSLALLDEGAAAAEVLAAGRQARSADGQGSCLDEVAGEVARLRRREGESYSIEELLPETEACARETSSTAPAHPRTVADWLGKLRVGEAAPRRALAAQDVAAGEVLLVQRPLLGPASAADCLSPVACAAARLEPGPAALHRRLQYAACTDSSVAAVVDCVGVAASGPQAEQGGAPGQTETGWVSQFDAARHRAWVADRAARASAARGPPEEAASGLEAEGLLQRLGLAGRVPLLPLLGQHAAHAFAAERCRMAGGQLED